MGPEIIAIVGVLVIGGMLRLSEVILKKNLSAKALPANDFTADAIANESLACDALVPRVFEQRLVDAGIMESTDMTVCESLQCPDCKPTRDAIHAKEKCAVAECQAKGTDRWNEHEVLCKAHWDVRKRSESSHRTLKSLDRYKPKKKEITLPGGNVIPWPEQVPEFAHYEIRRQDLGRGASINYDIMFTWIGKFGQTEYIKMVVPDFTHTSDKYVVYSDQNEKPVAQWDGAFSGRVSTTKEHRESLRRRGYKGTYPPLTPERRKAAIESIRKQGREQKKKEAVEAALRRGNMKFYDSAINRRNNFKCWCNTCDGKMLHPLPKPPKGPGAGSPFIPKHTLNRTP